MNSSGIEEQGNRGINKNSTHSAVHEVLYLITLDHPLRSEIGRKTSTMLMDDENFLTLGNILGWLEKCLQSIAPEAQLGGK